VSRAEDFPRHLGNDATGFHESFFRAFAGNRHDGAFKPSGRLEMEEEVTHGTTSRRYEASLSKEAERSMNESRPNPVTIS
jgi:hypothetical protein